MDSSNLPKPSHLENESELSRRYGREVANYFSGSPLNRISFLRTNYTFLATAVKHPSASFLLYNELAPLVNAKGQISYVSYTDVRPLIGENPFSIQEQITSYDSSVTIPTLVFLGINENVVENPLEWGIYKGAPFWALDITPKGSVKDQAEELIVLINGRNLSFYQGRIHLGLSSFEAAIYGQGRALLDWNARNPFCAACGASTLSINAGSKRTCPPTDKGVPRSPCPARKGINNICFPRTDPTVIMAVLSSDGRKVLLGRQKKWPPYWYSTLAGFCEPAESIEDAVRREVWEESGVVVGRVVIHSSQPWPFPANLMIGSIAQAVEGMEEIKLVHDPELEDAKWFPLEEVKEALVHGTSGLGEGPPPGYKEGSLRLPPSTAIANQLLQAIMSVWAEKDAKI